MLLRGSALLSLLVLVPACEAPGLEEVASSARAHFALGDVPCFLGDGGDLECLRDRACSPGADGAFTCEMPAAGNSVRLPGPFVQVAAYGQFVAALRQDGTVARWRWSEPAGTYLLGELVPQPAPSGSFTKIGDASAYGGCGLLTSGAIACWDDSGAPTQAPLAAADTTRRVEDAVPSGTYQDVGGSMCGLRTDGSIDCWYYSTLWEQRSHAPAGTGYVDLVEASASACARQASGSVTCWDVLGPTWNHTPTGPFAAISRLRSQGAVAPFDLDVWQFLGADGGAFCGIRSRDRGVECWDKDGPLGVPVTGPFVEIDDTCGLTTMGTVRCWSFRGQGESGDCKYHGDDARFEAANPCGTCGAMPDPASFCGCGGQVTCSEYDGPRCDATPPTALADSDDSIGYFSVGGTLDTFDEDVWTQHVHDNPFNILQPEFALTLPAGESALLTLRWKFDRDGSETEPYTWRVIGGEPFHVSTSVGAITDWLKDGSGVATISLSHIGGAPSCAPYELKIKY